MKRSVTAILLLGMCRKLLPHLEPEALAAPKARRVVTHYLKMNPLGPKNTNKAAYLRNFQALYNFLSSVPACRSPTVILPSLSCAAAVQIQSDSSLNCDVT